MNSVKMKLATKITSITIGLVLLIIHLTMAQSIVNLPVYKNGNVNIEERVTDLMSRMTIAEKIEQLTNDAEPNTRLGIPNMTHGELLHCVIFSKPKAKELNLNPNAGSTIFPQAIAMGGTWDPELVERIANAVAREARSLGIHHAYSPVLDVARDPRFGRVEETYGEDPYLVSRMGVAYINGLQGKGANRFGAKHVLATGKHFVGYHEVAGGLNGAYANISERTMYEIHFPPFEAAVKEAKVACIMPSHHNHNGIPCHMNSWLIDDILRKKWGFDGFVVSDNIDIYRLYNMHKIAKNEEEAAIFAMKAGVDMELDLTADKPFSTYQKTLASSIEKGWINVSYLNQAVKRVLEAKFKLGLFDDPIQEDPNELLGNKEHRKLALEAAEKAVTLLKNDGILPLNTKKYKKIAIIGPHGNRVEHGGYTGGFQAYSVSLIEALPKYFPSNTSIKFAQGTSIAGTDKKGFEEAIKFAKESDLVIFSIGGSRLTCGEGADRDELGLPGVQQDLFDQIAALGKPVVTILHNGRPLTIPEVVEKSDALIEGWYLGCESGTALSKVLTGEVNPGGKLTMTFPKNIGQLPSFYQKKPSFNGLGRGKYFKSDSSPLFPFGFGLSYTTFEISNLRLSKNNIGVEGSTTLSVDVKNTGKTTGDEVVQLYVSDEFASIGRWDKELKGFKRITLNPGELKTIDFKVGFDELCFFDVNFKKVVEPGKFFLRVGNSSTNLTDIELMVGESNQQFNEAQKVREITDKDDAEIGPQHNQSK